MNRGVFALNKLEFLISKGGSSVGTRDFIKNELAKFAEQNGHINFKIVESNIAAVHPKIVGSYANGYSRSVSLRNKSAKEVMDFITRLKNNSGRPTNVVRWPAAKSAKPSLQGSWSVEVNRTLPVTRRNIIAEDE